jgi:N-acetylglucosamine malate deacetylase 1
MIPWGNDKLRALVIAPHADDETLGVGGTIARLVSAGHHVSVAVMTGHGETMAHPLWPRSAWEGVRAEARKAMAVLGVEQLLLRELPAACVAQLPTWQVNREAQAVLEQTQPDLLFVPFLWDLHKDHREIFHAFSVAWRTSSAVGRKIRNIYAYETLSETHWNSPLEPGFIPNTHLDISEFIETKLRALACYVSQVQPAPNTRSLEATRAQAVWRGAQIGVPAAEAFVLVRALA